MHRATFAASVVILSLVRPAGADDVDWKARGEAVLATVRDHFFDAARAGAWAQEHAHDFDGVRDRGAFVEAAKAAVRRLGASHTAFFSSDDPEYHGLRSIFERPGAGKPAVECESIGVDLAPGGFVRVAFAGSPAEAAGLRRGDEIVSADGSPFRPVASLRGKAGMRVTLVVRSRRDGPTREVIVTPRKVKPKEEWLEHQEKGARVVERNGKKVAYMHLFSAAGAEPLETVRDAIIGRFADADALVLDFRHGWGGASPEFVDLFHHAPPALEQIGRDGTRQRYDPHWRKPLVLLVNGGSTSGKEAVAFAIQARKIGKLVGENTAGAVLAGRLFPIGGDSLLYLAVADVRVDGVRLEGRGVAPDVPVADRLPYAEGADPQLEEALDVAAR